MNMKAKENLAIIGATGLVGEEFQKLLAKHDLLKDFEVLRFRRARNEQECEWSLSEDSDKLSSCKYIFNAASSDAALQVGKDLRKDQYLIDNSSAYRMHSQVPLVVPEVNGHLITKDQNIFANPNCTACILCVSLVPLKKYGIKQLFVSTYQAASGAGKEGLEELRNQLSLSANSYKSAYAKGETSTKIFGFPLGRNVMSHNSAVRGNDDEAPGFNDEEFKVIQETRKIMGLEQLPIAVTCMRVPVERAHTETVVVDLEQAFDLKTLKAEFQQQFGIQVVDDAEKNHFPMPIEADGQNDVFVGRLRKDPTIDKRLLYLISGDQLLKGAAWNAFQIFQKLMSL